jgi:conserved oligomeric Golgi complex subunit 5
VNKTSRELEKALENNQNGDETIIKCLQIFSNLQILTKTLDHMLENFLNDIKHMLKECFAGADVASLQKNSQKKDSAKNAASRTVAKGPGKTPTLTTSQHFRTKLWLALEWIFSDEIYSHCQQALRLNRCLEKVGENSGEKNDIVEKFHTIFWGKLEDLLKESFTTTAPQHVLQCLNQGLPKLLAASKSLTQKLDNKYEFHESMFEALEVGYLEKCGSNLKASLLGVDNPEKVKHSLIITIKLF